MNASIASSLALSVVLLAAPRARADGAPSIVPVLAMRGNADDGPPSSPPARPADGLFPGGGRVTLGASTGVPFLAIGEIGYGFSDRFTVGAIAGVTPRVEGFGVRPRVVVYQGDRARAFVSAPILYYPPSGMSGDEPWYLANPVVFVETPVGGGWRVRGGPGIVGAACQDSLLGRRHEERFMGDLWPTLAAGVTRSIGARSEVFLDAQAVLPKGVAFDRDWIGGPPFTLSLGIAAEP